MKRFSQGAVLGALVAALVAGGSGPDGPAAAQAAEVKLDALTLTVPAQWQQQRPSNNLRLGQFQIPAVAGDQEPAELGIFNFGFGGGVKENVARWIGQFEPDGREVKITRGASKQGSYVFVDLRGTHKKPIGPPVQQRTQPAPGYRMLGVILAIEGKGNYFLKLVGPEKTVAAAAEAFRTSFGGNAASEKEYDPEKPE